MDVQKREPPPYSQSQLRAAGKRMRRSTAGGAGLSDVDRTILSTYRAWHYPALREAQERLERAFHKKLAITNPLIVDVTARPLRTEDAIVAKLTRERTSLGRMQDIAGARIVVATIDLQDLVVGYVMRMFQHCDPRIAKDTREKADRNGYRAVHVVITLKDRLVEIQIRTLGQDPWAQIVEKADSIFGWDLKHGHGPAEWLEWLQEFSDELRKRDLGQTYVLPPMPIDEKTGE